MGTLYYVGCFDCGVFRDLNKFYTIGHPVETREDALEMSERMSKDSFRASLLASFLWKHKGHSCTVFDEHMGEHMFPAYKYDIDEHYDNPNEESDIFWSTQEDG